MTEAEARAFIEKYTAARATREDAPLEAMWHREGKLHYPLTDRVICGHEIARVNQAAPPDMAWNMIGWTWRGDVVVLEWECTTGITWRGVDKFTLKNGKIIEEVVYMDTQPLWAARDPAMARGPMQTF